MEPKSWHFLITEIWAVQLNIDFVCAGGGVFYTRREEYLKMQESNKSIFKN